MSSEQRVAAADRLQALRRFLESQPDAAGFAHSIAECDALARAVDAFHVEAIRFRMYGLHRKLTAGARVPDEALRLLEEARTALQAAGFKTK